MQGLDGRTADLTAAQNGHTGIVKYLIEANANVNIKSSSGLTALIQVAQNRHTYTEIITHLTEPILI